MPKLERLISVFKKNDETLIEEISVDFIGLETLRKIFTPSSNDPDMLLVYPLGETQAAELKRYLDIQFDFTNNIYQLDCFDAS